MLRPRHLAAALLAYTLSSLSAYAQSLQSFEILTHRMDADCDGAPTAYGPPGKPALDYLRNAHTLGNLRAPIVGYLTEGRSQRPVTQGPNDPAPGYYVSQTAFTDPARTDERDPLRYVDASKINYVVLGNRAHRQGAREGDFVAVHSLLTGGSVFGIVGDTGNPTGDEGSLHLLQALGYNFHNCKRESVEQSEVVVRFYPRSNPNNLFFRTQEALDDAARKAGLNLHFEARKKDR